MFLCFQHLLSHILYNQAGINNHSLHEANCSLEHAQVNYVFIILYSHQNGKIDTGTLTGAR